MIRIHPDTFYTKEDLAEALPIDVDHFLSVLRPRKVFKVLYWGRDLIEAINQAPPLEHREDQVRLLYPPDRERDGVRGGRVDLEEIM